MQQDKLVNQDDRKRKMLLVLPLLFLPFIILLFYSLGGGKSKPKDETDKRGINTNLPSAQIDNSKPSDKLSVYKQADQDADKLGIGPALGPSSLFAQESEDTPVKDHAPSYAPHPGAPDNTPYHSRSRLEENEAKVRSRITTLQQVIRAADDSAVRVKPPEQSPMLSLSTFPGLPSGANSNAAADTERDPEMKQLNDMLEKVLDVQHPERVQSRIREASQKDPTRVFRVTTTNPQGTDDWTASAATPDSLKKLASARLGSTTRFFELDGAAEEDNIPNTIEAVIHQTQVLVSGATVKLRLTNDIFVQGHEIRRGTFVFGICELNGERLKVHIDKIASGASVYPVSLSVYGLDGLEGIYVPGAISRDASKQGADQALQSMQLASMSQSLGAQAAASGMETVKSLLQKKVRLIRVTIKADQPVLLYADHQ